MINMTMMRDDLLVNRRWCSRTHSFDTYIVQLSIIIMTQPGKLDIYRDQYDDDA